MSICFGKDRQNAAVNVAVSSITRRVERISQKLYEQLFSSPYLFNDYTPGVSIAMELSRQNQKEMRGSFHIKA
jgi:hypothetical protein